MLSAGKKQRKSILCLSLGGLITQIPLSGFDWKQLNMRSWNMRCPNDMRQLRQDFLIKNPSNEGWRARAKASMPAWEASGRVQDDDIDVQHILGSKVRSGPRIAYLEHLRLNNDVFQYVQWSIVLPAKTKVIQEGKGRTMHIHLQWPSSWIPSIN